MKIKKIYKLDRAVSRTDANRFATQFVHVDGNNARAVATDGRIMASVPCELSPVEDLVGESALIPVDALKAARKAAGRGADEVAMHYGEGKVRVDNGDTVEAFDQGRGEFPNYRNVLPNPEHGIVVTLNAELLHRLADAIGSDGAVTLTFQKDTDGKLDPKRPIHVVPISADGDTGAVGVIMPIVRA
jgi:DNA polymerase III sliding clamp (beta) subunit (PCNA family)